MLKLIIDFSIMVFVGAFIGWITNYIAIRLLFRPYNEIKIIGIKFQGVIPKRKKVLAESIAKTVEEHLLSVKDITEKIDNIEIDEELDIIIKEIVNTKLKANLISKIPMAAMFLNDSMMEKISVYIKEVFVEHKSDFVAIFAKKLEEEIDFRKIVQEKIENFSLEKLESIILGIAKRELQQLEIMGGVLGGLVGIIQFILMRVIIK